MGFLLNKSVGIFGKSVLGTGRAVIGNPVARMGAGAAIGGAYGGLASDSNTSTGRLRDATVGAAAGLGIASIPSAVSMSARLHRTAKGYGAARSVGGGILESISFGNYAAGTTGTFRNIGTAAMGIGRTGANIGIGLGKGALSTGKFAYQHPYAALGIAAGGYGMYSLSQSGGDSGMTAGDMAAVAERTGISSTGFQPGMGNERNQISRQMFTESTFGLTQGLHRSRHRG